MPDKAVLDQVGYMTQVSALYEELTVRENVAFFAEISGRCERAGIGEVIELVDLGDRAGSVVRTLSGGMRQRASLACALAHRPQLLLLDEPTVGVDPQLRATFWSYFRQLADSGVTLVISSHVMDEAERCDRLGFLRQGRLLAEGSAADLRRAAGTATLEEAFLQFSSTGAAGGLPMNGKRVPDHCPARDPPAHARPAHHRPAVRWRRCSCSPWAPFCFAPSQPGCPWVWSTRTRASAPR